MVTNGEKFKTADERRRWYSWYCKLCDEECIKPVDEFNWLDLYYEEDLRRCPFCDGDATFYSNEAEYIRCDKCGAQTALYQMPEDAIAAWNRRVR